MDNIQYLTRKEANMLTCLNILKANRLPSICWIGKPGMGNTFIKLKQPLTNIEDPHIDVLQSSIAQD